MEREMADLHIDDGEEEAWVILSGPCTQDSFYKLCLLKDGEDPKLWGQFLSNQDSSWNEGDRVGLVPIFEGTTEEGNYHSELGFRGGLSLGWKEDKNFTWEMGNLPETNIKERLDRSIANSEWLKLFPEYSIQHLSHSFSDHCSILIQIKQEALRLRRKWFRFEAWWAMKESCKEEVKRLWTLSKGSLIERLDIVGKGLQRWAIWIKKLRTNLSRKLIT
ncbi:reverse transcriptase [Gossypium australe]|uniref:Reverse transcriptase n=1 Tax=Gossypium australe TaxID=47621 RepID=A0A5B6VKG0_9ROSI|nr:reverse transcriptase [Gossypium australe]